ncbi:MAG: hypothetical protein J5723_09595 [Ruminococcus sp.]|nr:hypothetical protein [Ruminococcus sp.]
MDHSRQLDSEQPQQSSINQQTVHSKQWKDLPSKGKGYRLFCERLRVCYRGICGN